MRWHLYCLEAKVRRFWSAFTWKVVFNYILLFKWLLLELEIITSQLLKISKISHTKSPKIATKIMVNIDSKDITIACKWMTVTAWKVSKYGVFFGPYFPVFGLINLRIHSEYRKIRTRKNSVFGHFSRSELVTTTSTQDVSSMYVRHKTSKTSSELLI